MKVVTASVCDEPDRIISSSGGRIARLEPLIPLMSTFRLHSRRLIVSLLACATLASEASAQGQPPRGSAPQVPPAVDLPAPQAPATVSRANGQVVVRAIHLAEPLTVDGKLDESVYRDNLPVDGF